MGMTTDQIGRHEILFFLLLQWLPFYEESKIAKCCVAYKRIKGEVPLYTVNSLILNSQQHNRATRYSNTYFICPRFNRMTEGGRSFAVTTCTCQLWNSLRCLHRVLRACTDDASFSNVRALADASSCKAANKSTI